MIRLNLSPEPRWLDLLPGLRLRVHPVTTSVMTAARFDPLIEALPADAGEDEKALALARAIGRQVIADWEGVGDASGRPVPVSPEAIDALLDLWPVFEAFQREVLGPHLLWEAEKNASAPLPSGTSAGAKATARPAKARARTARRG